MSIKIKTPDGWRINKRPEFAVELKDGKPPGATAWFDVQGRPVVKEGSTWKLQKQRPAPPRKLSKEEVVQRQKPAPPKKLSKEEVAQRQKPAPPRKLSKEEIEQKSGRDAQARQPKTDSEGDISLAPEEAEQYNKFSALAKEKIAEGTKKSFYPDPEQARRDEEGRKQRFAPYAALSDDQLSSINAYTSEWDTNMNSYLRNGKIELSTDQRLGGKPKPSETQVKKAIRDLQGALESLPKAPAGTFRRGVSGSYIDAGSTKPRASDFIKQLHSLEEGDVLEDPGFSSFTSGGGPVIDQFLQGTKDSDQNIVFEVESDQMRDISKISKYEREKEHMLPPGAKFRVTGRSEGWSRRAGKHLVIHLKQI